MKNPPATAVAIVCVLALVAWLAYGSADANGTEKGPANMGLAARGSALPCAVPLAWRIDRVDPRFGITDEGARAAVQAAAALWEHAVGARLFVHDATHGFPVIFVHDGRQAAALDRQRVEADLRRADRELDHRRAEIDRRASSHERAAAEFDERARAAEIRAAHHNQVVRTWNERGGAPPDTVRALRAMGAALDTEAAELDRWHRDLERTSRRIHDDQRRLNDAIEAHNRRMESLARVFPAQSVESARYREEARVHRGRVRAVSREISVFRFDDSHDLVRIIAHELGHAMGLGHVDEPGALMSEEYARMAAGSDGVIGRRDLELFRDRCPHIQGAPAR